MGPNVRDWLANVLAAGRAGSADLVAYFFLRATSSARDASGTLGLIATNTIAQGDTREVGLDQLVERGIRRSRARFRADRGRQRQRNLEFAAVWGTRSSFEPTALDVSRRVAGPRISTLLEPRARHRDPDALAGERWYLLSRAASSMGCGFVLDDERGASMDRSGSQRMQMCCSRT